MNWRAARSPATMFRPSCSTLATGPTAPGTDSAACPDEASYDIRVPVVNLGINFLPDGFEMNGAAYKTGDLLRMAGLALAAIFCVWLISLLLRLLLRGAPRFEPWQPPYSANSWHDPNSTQGRRQAWQFHAQNCLIEAPRAPNQVTVIKRLTDDDGLSLGGWRVKALRTTQYDVYGRINRSEVVMPQKLGKQLTRLARRAPGLSDEQLTKAALPIARRIGRLALGPIEKQNLALPLALDMRFEGERDVARVVFELYQYHAEAWRMIDQWQPELGSHVARIPEHYSFSLNGQLPGESEREFKTRLREDLTGLLLGTLRQAPPPESGLDDSAGVDDEPRSAEKWTRKRNGRPPRPMMALPRARSLRYNARSWKL